MRIPHSEETKRKISIAHFGIKPSAETRKKMSENRRGKKRKPHSDETKQKIRLRLLGNKNNLGNKRTEETKLKVSEEKHWNWKGDLVGYWGLHNWVSRQLGKPTQCEFCGTGKARKFEWANKSGNYLRDITDWLRLCTKCHRNYDYSRGI